MWVWLLCGGAIVWGGLRVFGGYRPAGAGLGRLWRAEVALLDSAADTLYPPGGPVPPSGSEVGVAAYTDRYLQALPRATRLLMHLLFFLVEHATLFFPAPGPSGMRRFSSLDEGQRAAVLEGWRTSRFFPRRLVFTSLRAILTMAYFSDPTVLRCLRLAPYAIETPVCEADLLYPRIGQLPDSISHVRASAASSGQPLELEGALHPRYAEPPG